jgi:hypothetical protein
VIIDSAAQIVPTQHNRIFTRAEAIKSVVSLSKALQPQAPQVYSRLRLFEIVRLFVWLDHDPLHHKRESQRDVNG